MKKGERSLKGGDGKLLACKKLEAGKLFTRGWDRNDVGPTKGSCHPAMLYMVGELQGQRDS